MFETGPDHTCLTFFNKKVADPESSKAESASNLLNFLFENDAIAQLSYMKTKTYEGNGNLEDLVCGGHALYIKPGLVWFNSLYCQNLAKPSQAG